MDLKFSYTHDYEIVFTWGETCSEKLWSERR